VLIEGRDGLTENDRLRLSEGLEGLDKDDRLRLSEGPEGLDKDDWLRLSDGLEGLDKDGRLEPIDGLGRGLGLRDGMLGLGEIDRLPMDGLLRRVEMEKPPRELDEGGRLMELREPEDRLRLESLPSAELRLELLLLSDGEDRTCGALGRLGARADRIADRREAELLPDDAAPSTEEAASKAPPTTKAMILAR
jgi:hypothetical protein